MHVWDAKPGSITVNDERHVQGYRVLQPCTLSRAPDTVACKYSP
jgi:hypothetical protein